MRLAIFIVGLSILSAGPLLAADQPNILFIAVDDLRPQLNCYGKSEMVSPNIDRIAERGVLFERAYCMVPTCGASRASLLTGVRPSARRFVNYLAWAERDAKGVMTLNTHFKAQGYRTISLGKIFHHPEDNVDGWSEKPWRASTDDYQNAKGVRKAISDHLAKYPNAKKMRGPAYEAAEAADTEYRDGLLAEKAIEYLEQFAGKEDGVPFFLAVGFMKPHLPFTAPKKYWDMYDESTIRLPENYFPPKGAPAGAVHQSGELRAYAGIPPKGPVDEETAKKLIHGYYACVSFTDAQVGKVLDTLDRLKLDDNTIVVLWGDHGWQLGEHGMWNKHSCFETSMHAPLLIVAPNQTGVQPGTRVRALTEFIDIYPSLCELAGTAPPEHLEGQSLLPLMENPDAPWKNLAVGRFGKGDTIKADLNEGSFRFSEYSDGRGHVTGQMMYDHQSDPDENTNIVEESSRRDVAGQLARSLDEKKGRDTTD